MSEQRSTAVKSQSKSVRTADTYVQSRDHHRLCNSFARRAFRIPVQHPFAPISKRLCVDLIVKTSS
jgi:hypothetical protein